MAYEPRPGFARKPKIEIRVVRLVISVVQCDPLARYYFDPQKMDLACTYNEIDFRSIIGEYAQFPISQESLGIFFDWLHRNSQPRFARLMEYSIRGVFLDY